MPKVVTSTGLNEFVSSGKPTEEIKTPPKIKAVANGAAPPLEVKEDKPLKDLSTEKKEEPKEEERAPEIDDKTDWMAKQSADVLEEITRKNATINRKHREMKEAQSALADAEEFARTQWNEKRVAAERAAQLEKELAELKEKGAPAPVKAEKGKPDPAKFYDDKGQFKAFEYAEELAAFSANKAVEDDRKAQAKAAQERALAAAEEKARARVGEAQKKYPDYESVMAASTAKTHKEVLGYLTDSPFIGDVSYYMAKNPAFVERINAMHPYAAIAEIGKLELTFVKPDPAKAEEEPAPKVTPGAPPPIKPLAASSSVNINTDPAKMTYKELRAFERARMGRRP